MRQDPARSTLNALEALSLANILRGNHGAGIAFGNKTVGIIKTAGTSADLSFSGLNGRFIGGHTRYATSKFMGKKNTHPFKAGPITLMHNGVINPGARKKLSAMGKKCDVDSEEIAHALANKSCDAVLSVLLEERANFALVWHDARDGGVRMVRETSRPLHLVKYDAGFLYSSEEDDLEWGLAKSGGPKQGAIKQLNPYVLLESLPGEEITARKLPPPPPIQYQQYPQHQSSFLPYQTSQGTVQCDMCEERPATSVVHGCDMCYQCRQEYGE